MYTIYKVTNTINGKAYIGFDSNWPSRKSVHICEAITRQNKKYPLYRAIKKYGVDSFTWEILHQSADREHTLNTMEKKFIMEQNTHFRDGHGYNMTYGGEGAFGWVPSQETRERISKAKRGKSTLTDDGREAKRKFTRENNPMSRSEVKAAHRAGLLKSKTNAKAVTNGITNYKSIRDAQKDYPDIKYQTLWYWVSKNKNGWSYRPSEEKQ